MDYPLIDRVTGRPWREIRRHGPFIDLAAAPLVDPELHPEDYRCVSVVLLAQGFDSGVTLSSGDSYQLPSGRVVWTCAGVPGLNPRTLIGQTITLDGRRVVVRGAETFAVMDPTGLAFGLVVDDVESAETPMNMAPAQRQDP